MVKKKKKKSKTAEFLRTPRTKSLISVASSCEHQRYSSSHRSSDTEKAASRRMDRDYCVFPLSRIATTHRRGSLEFINVGEAARSRCVHREPTTLSFGGAFFLYDDKSMTKLLRYVTHAKRHAVSNRRVE